MGAGLPVKVLAWLLAMTLSPRAAYSPFPVRAPWQARWPHSDQRETEAGEAESRGRWTSMDDQSPLSCAVSIPAGLGWPREGT